MIVSSILLAFGIDAMWDWNQERNEEREALVRIHDELERDRQRLLAPGFQHRAESAALTLAERLDDLSPGTTTLEVSDSLLWDLVAVPTFETQTPGLDALRQSGRISIIRADEVRARIADWENAVTNLFEWEQRARTFVDTQLVLALGQRGDVAHVLRASFFVDDGADLGGTTRLRADLELKVLVSQRYGTASLALLGREQLASAAADLMTSIQASLER